MAEVDSIGRFQYTTAWGRTVLHSIRFVLDVCCQVDRVGDLNERQPLVLQGAEARVHVSRSGPVRTHARATVGADLSAECSYGR